MILALISRKGILGKKFYRMNHNIRVPEIFLIDENGNAIGNVSTGDALKRALDAELDLVEISPNVSPPVCKIIDFGKFKYELEKQERKQKARNKGQDLKEIRLSIRIDTNDLELKKKQARKFLEKRDKVKVSIRLMGREMAFQDKAREIINTFWKSMEDIAKIEQPMKRLGKQYNMILAPDQKPKKKDEKTPNTPSTDNKPQDQLQI